jgi:hypothetical protein
MSRTKLAVTLLIALGLMSLHSPGQSESTSPGTSDSTNPQYVVSQLPPPATKLESFAALRNIVLVKGYSKVATVGGDDGAAIQITAVDFSSADAKAPERHQGLAIQVTEGNRTNRSALSYIDADEIDPLLDAIAKLTQLQSTATRLTDYDAGFRTTGDLEITNLSRDGTREAGIRSVQILRPSGQICTATAYFRLGRLQELSQQIATAKQTLERMNESATAGK